MESPHGLSKQHRERWIGLPLEHMGGTLAARNEGDGAVFTVVLPRQERHGAS
jgi:signal transduction histidine kinase